MIKTNKWVRLVWVCLLLGAIILYVFYGRDLTPERIAAWITAYRGYMLLVYFLVCVLRGITLIPSTPFLLAGILLFRDTPLLLALVFMAGVLFSSTLLFYASSYAGLATRFERLYPNKMDLLRRRLSGRYGFGCIFFWAFIPFTPTDLVCYVAGSLGMRYAVFILPLMLGESLISLTYIFNGHWLLGWL